MIQIWKEDQDETLQRSKTCNEELVTRLMLCTIHMEFQLEKKRNNLRNYIGVIVRERVPIIYDYWRKVPLDIKETL